MPSLYVPCILQKPACRLSNTLLQKLFTTPVIPSPARDLYWNIVPCVISAERKRAEKSLAKSCESFIQFVWQYRLHTALARRSKDPFEGARSFTLLARGKTSAPQSAAYGRKPRAICCRKRQLFRRRLLRGGFAAAPLRVTQSGDFAALRVAPLRMTRK